MVGVDHKASSPLRRLTAVFEGRVQGVGFRFTVAEIARRYPVRGYVQNTMQGDVQMVAEGQERDVLAFLDAVRASHVFRFVHQQRLSWAAGTGEYSGFDIRYA